MQLIIGILFGIIVSGFARWLGALNRSGFLAAALIGSLVFGLGGLAWAVLLLIFFITSSVLSRVNFSQKSRVKEKYSKGSRRDWGQVLANGGVGALCVIAHAFFPQIVWIWVAYAGSLAAVTADTWATELGVLDPKLPRLINNGQTVVRGTSGAISLGGSLAAVAGAVTIGIVTAFLTSSILSIEVARNLVLVLAVSAGGIGGSFFDSLLGATLQGIYYCPECGKTTEQHPYHTCGTRTRHVRGWRWMNNDIVNFLAAVIGSLAAIGFWVLTDNLR
ncbi:MAG: DUF92 domain-containing protein [Chloroflexota bacterium]|nr:DUF92 domain-containing protein [Chloroflexota bacterium]